MSTRVIQLSKTSLAIQTLPTAVQELVPAPVDHLIVIDISGSMYYDLPELRLQLKNKLASLVKDKDTVTIVWFSGRGQYGVLVEQLEIRSLQNLSELNAAIDRYLTPQGLTGFKEPLLEVLNVIERISTKRKDSLFSLFFMTDGYDNQWSDKDILDVCAKLAPRLSNAVIVEYGWNCNRALLAKMAEMLGGKLLFNKDLHEYRLTFENEISGGVGAKKVPVKLAHRASAGYAFALHNGGLLSFLPDANNTVLVPEGLTELAYLTDVPGEAYERSLHDNAAVWALLVPLSQRMDSDRIFDVLAALGDVALVESFANCFSKEDYVLFQDAALHCAQVPDARYALGYDAHAVPKEDAYTVLDLLAELSSSEENLFYPYHAAFAYERIGAASVEKAKTVKFVHDRSRGYPVNGIVWNEDRPNVSMRVCVPGQVILPEDRPAELPQELGSYIYRNYTIVRDGIVHTRKLPLSLSEATFEKLQAQGLLAGERWEAGKVFVLEFPKLPVINRQMVKGVTAAGTFAQVLQLLQLKGAQKVFNEFRDRYAPKVSAKFLALYGAQATEYLKTLGVTDYNGFNPPSDTVKSGDFYMAKELKIAAKGLSSLAKVSDVEAALLAGKSKDKLKPSEAMLVDALEKVQEFMNSKFYLSAADKDALLVTWLETESKAVIRQTRELMQALAKNKFAIVVGHTWFADMPSLDDNALDVSIPGYKAVTVTATLKDVEIEK